MGLAFDIQEIMPGWRLIEPHEILEASDLCAYSTLVFSGYINNIWFPVRHYTGKECSSFGSSVICIRRLTEDSKNQDKEWLNPWD